ncbi:MAG: hypothetical protein R2705_06565 [Ilumatobacteraceae bacterium]
MRPPALTGDACGVRGLRPPQQRRVAFDTPLAERRLARPAARHRPLADPAPSSTDLAVAAQWFGRFEGAGLDGVIAKRLDLPYSPGHARW